MHEALAGVAFVRRLVVLEATGSTNDDARRLAAEGAPEGTVVIAGSQSAGRGRRSRTWHSPAGLGLYVSVVLRPRESASHSTRWTTGAALAACEACRDVSGAPVFIKWPNDLMAGGRKVAGTLVEVRTAGREDAELVVGTGFNVNHGPDDFPHELRERAGSLRMARGGEPIEREALAASYLLALGTIRRRMAAGEWERVREEWSALAPGASGKRVRVLSGRTGGPAPFEATTRGIDEVGALLVQKKSGAIVRVVVDESVIPLEA